MSQVERIGDMDNKSRLYVERQEDGDIIVRVLEYHAHDPIQRAEVEFCSPGLGGGLSPATHEALRRLIEAIQEDNNRGRDAFTHKETLPKVPEPFTLNTGEGDSQGVIDKFFGEVMDYLDYSQKAREIFVHIEAEILKRRDKQGHLLPTDDILTLLIVQNFVAASVLQWRDEQNYAQVLSACYLTPRVVTELKKDKRLLVTK